MEIKRIALLGMTALGGAALMAGALFALGAYSAAGENPWPGSSNKNPVDDSWMIEKGPTAAIGQPKNEEIMPARSGSGGATTSGGGIGGSPASLAENPPSPVVEPWNMPGTQLPAPQPQPQSENPAPLQPNPDPNPAPQPQPENPAPLQPNPNPNPAPQPQPEGNGCNPCIEVAQSRVVSVTPEQGATGASLKPKISVTFSQPMDKASTEAAFSVVHPAANKDGAFSWDAGGKVLSFTPTSAVAYNQQVSFKVAATAKDAMGRPIQAEYAGYFWVLKKKTVYLQSQAALDGFINDMGSVSANATWLSTGGTDKKRAYVSFDLSQLPAATTKILDADLSIYQILHEAAAYTPQSGNLLARSITYGPSLDAADFATPVNQFCLPGCVPLQSVLSSTAADGWKSTNVLSMVNADWNLRQERGSRSQFQIRFEKEAAGASNLRLASGDTPSNHPVLKLEIEYK